MLKLCNRAQTSYLTSASYTGQEAGMRADRKMGWSNVSHHPEGIGGVLIHCYSASNQGTILGLDLIQPISSLLPRALMSEQLKRKLSELSFQCAFVLYLLEIRVAGIVWRAENATSHTVRSLCFPAFSSPSFPGKIEGWVVEKALRSIFFKCQFFSRSPDSLSNWKGS